MKKSENKTTKKILSLIKKVKKEKKGEDSPKLKQKEIKKYSMTDVSHVISKIREKELKYIMISVSVCVVLILTVCFVIFSSIQQSVYDSTIKSGKLLINYEEKNNNLGNIIDLTGKNDLDNYKEYYFSISNTSDEEKEYTVKIINNLEMIDIDGCKDKIVPRENIRYSYGEDILELSDDEIIIDEIIMGNSSKSYKLKIWIDGDYKKDNHFHGKIEVKQK